MSKVEMAYSIMTLEGELRKIGEIGKLAAEMVERERHENARLQERLAVENGKTWKRRAYTEKTRRLALAQKLDKEHQKLCNAWRELSFCKQELDAKEGVIDKLLLEISKLKEVSPE